MEAAQLIRQAVAEVNALREAGRRDVALAGAVLDIKRLQARRFAGTYADLLAGGPYTAAARFFLEELYGDKDYAERDAQFARIAGAIQRFFPEDVVETAVGLAQLHALTERLDQSLALRWLQAPASGDAARYVAAWREVGDRAARERQLHVVLGIGDEMIRLTRKPGLRMMLRMMRGPASAAGLGSLQQFLEAGFDTFAALSRTGAAREFLDLVARREGRLIADLFDADPVACGTQLGVTLGQAP